MTQELNDLKSLIGRLERVVSRLESGTTLPTVALGEPPSTTLEDEEVERQVKALEEAHEARLWEAEQMVDKLNSGTLTEEERDEYLNRWKRTTVRG